MQFSKSMIAFAALLFAPAALAASVSVSYDNSYDDSGASLDTVACSDGPNGLITKGYSTIGSLPDFPYVGGASAVSGWNSADCGTCWELTYDGESIYVLAIDHADDGFNISEEAMNKLTNNQAVRERIST